MKKILRTMLVLMICIATLFSMTSITANAETILTQTISEGEEWHESWTSQTEYSTVNLNVEQTGFYDITVTDYKQTGWISATICDVDTLEFMDIGLFTEVASTHEFSTFLTEGHSYQLICQYFEYDELVDEIFPMDAEIAIIFNESTQEPPVIPSCSLASSDLMVQFTEYDYSDWLKFSTSSAGDYCLNFANLSACVSVYNASTGELCGSYDTEYYNIESSEWLSRGKLVFNLSANTDYYIQIQNYSEEQVSTKLSMTKNAKTVKTISPSQALYNFYSGWDVSWFDASCFSYLVIYADNTSDNYDDFIEIYEAGYDCPTFEYLGDTVDINGETYLLAGEQPIEYTYNGLKETIYVNIISLTEQYNDWEIVDEDDNCIISYEDDEYHTGWWRVRMSRSGVYSIWRYNSDDFGTNFTDYSIKIVDEKNNLVEYNDDKMGWPLVANKDYIINFNYCYDPYYSYNDIEFWLSLDGWNLHNGKWYFYEGGEMVTNAWRKDSKGWVKLGDDGAMLTNKWTTDSKGWCYVGADGYAVTNCWKKDSKGWIWLNSNGSMTKSKWVKDNGKWYYLDANGYMVTNKWQKDSKGWVKLGSNGAMLVNCWATDSKGWCYVGADGYAVTNCWKKDSKGWIYLDANGSMTKSKWVKDGGKWYYCDANGYMVANKTIVISGKKYTFDKNGVWVK